MAIIPKEWFTRGTARRDPRGPHRSPLTDPPWEPPKTKRELQHARIRAGLCPFCGVPWVRRLRRNGKGWSVPIPGWVTDPERDGEIDPGPVEHLDCPGFLGEPKGPYDY